MGQDVKGPAAARGGGGSIVPRVKPEFAREVMKREGENKRKRNEREGQLASLKQRQS